MPSFTLLLALSLPLLILTPTSVARDLPTDLTGFPPCAQTCISTNHGSCALLDMPCMCTNQVPTIFSCMQGSCDASDQATTLEFAQELCEKANATAAAIPSGSSPRTTLSTATGTATAAKGTETAPTTGSSSQTDTEIHPSPSAPPPSAAPSPTATAGAGAGTKPLSTGATAGIGLGATAGAIALAGCAFLLWRRRRRQRAQVFGEDGRGASGKAGGMGMGMGFGMRGPVVRLDDGEGGVGTPVDERKGVHHEVEGVGVQWMELEGKEVVRYGEQR